MPRGFRIALAAALAGLAASGAAAEPRRVGTATLEPVRLDALPGFAGEDHARALTVFRASCATRAIADPQPDSVAGTRPELAAACEAADRVGPGAARGFFETRFDAFRVLPSGGTARTGLLTGYFEPELPGALTPGPGYTAPALARPPDLVSFQPGETRPGLDPALRAARATAGGFAPYPERAAIEDGALGALARPVLWLRDAVDLQMLQIQGSGRIRLPDGSSRRLLYDGKNGHPFTGVPRLIVQEGHLPRAGLSLERWMGWLRANPEHARRLMRKNASYVFFRLETVTDPALGPLGASKAALAPGRSIAVDGGLWRYGLPFWLEGRLPEGGGAPAGAGGRLVVAQDTGSAIQGPARGDFYVGTGLRAGEIAGAVHDRVGFVVLLPKGPPPKPPGAAADR